MQIAREPIEEDERLEKLRAYQVLDTLPEQVYDDIAMLASSICHTPIALISLVDADRQWFKAKVGLSAEETSRDVAFCAHTIRGADIFEVSDSRLDPRFQDNPLVTEDPHVVFYAGAPIVTPEGLKVGTLCVIDNSPRSLDAEQREMLVRLSRQAAYILEQRIVAEKRDLLNSQLEQANAELAQFSYRASHDLKAPLVSMKRLSQYVSKDLQDGKQADAISNVERIGMVAARLEHVVANIISLRRASLLQTRSSDLELFSLQSLIDEVRESQAELFIASSCNLIIEIPSDLVVYNEKLRFHEVIENLLVNAAMYRDTSKDSCHVRLACSRQKGVIRLDITDNGLGIPAEYHAEVMDPFTRFHPGLSNGAGLGLAIVNKHVEALAGSIDFTSVIGVGTTMSLLLPTVEEGDNS